MSNIFNKYYKKYDSWYDKNKFAYLSEIEALKKSVPKESKGLEIGVGTGRFASRLGIKYGVDPAYNMLKVSKKRRIDVRHAQGERLPFESSSFDYVAVIITLCFVKDPIKVLIEAKRVLKKNGKIIIAIVDRSSFLGRFYQKKKSLFYKKARFFSTREVTDLLKMSGFGKVSYYQTLYKLPDKMKSVDKPGKGFGKGGFVVITGVKRRR